MKDEGRAGSGLASRILACCLPPSALCLLILSFRHFRAEVLGEAAADRPFRAPAVRSEKGGGDRPPLLTLDAAARASGCIGTLRLAAARFQAEAVAVGVVVEPVDLAATRDALRAENSPPPGSSGDEAPADPPQSSAGEPSPDNPAAAGPHPSSLIPHPFPTLSRQVALGLYGPVLTDWLAADSEELAPFFRHRETLLRLTPLPGASSAPAAPEAAVTDFRGETVPARLVAVAYRPDAGEAAVSYFYRAPDDPLRPRFVPGMAVSARLPQGPTLFGVAVPAAAVVRRAGTPWAYVEETPGRFRRRAVSLDHPLPDGGGWFQEQAWQAGETAVTAGGALLLAEEATNDE